MQHAVLLVSIRALGDTYPGRALGEAHGMHLVDYIGKLRSDAARCARSGYNMRANIPHSLQNTVCARRTRLAAHRCYSGMRDAHVWVNPSQRNVCLRACVHMQAALSAANLTDALKAQVRVGVAYV